VKKLVLVAIGEILWDVLPDGQRFGGAPCNFACSAAELTGDAAEVFIVSAVGRDELGERALSSLAQHGVQTEAVQRNDHETGQVLVQLDPAGVASYRFAENSAWDHLEWTDSLRQLAAKADAVCFGTLGQRCERSRSTIGKFVEATPPHALRLVDVNLRPPFVNADVILESLRIANVLKLNDDELPQLAELCGARGSDLEILRQIAARFQLRSVALTRGAGGAIIVTGDDVSDLPGLSVQVADTIGAGDAFSAAMTLGLLANRSLGDLNRLAIQTAAFVCTQSGATMPFPDRLCNAVGSWHE
jgi:fructokinase